MVGVVPESYFSTFVSRINPTPTMVSEIQSLHNTIRSLFDESNYDTFLQGSYRNNTATKEINDVDIVVLRKLIASGPFSQEKYVSTISWDSIRQAVLSTLNSHGNYRGKIEQRPKCFRINTRYKVDVVPAVRIAPRWEQDPIAICSHPLVEISTSPRIHSDQCEAKNQLNKGHFKPIVRMFKWWSQRQKLSKKHVPSFCIESLLFNIQDGFFTGNYGADFLKISKALLRELPLNVVLNNPRIVTPGEGKALFAQNGWAITNYMIFYAKLSESYRLMTAAASTPFSFHAIALWKNVFGDEFPSSA